MLDEIGMVLESEDPWENGFQHAQAYYQLHGDLNVPAPFVCKDGYRLGLWIKNQRAALNRSEPGRRLSEEQKKRLEAIGMKWKPAEEQWMEAYAHAKAYLQLLNGEPWRVLYRSPDGFKTGEWIRGQMRNCKNQTISRWKQELLAEIGLNVEENTDTVA